MSKFNLKNYNFILIFCIIALSAIGILAIRSATNGDTSLVNKQIYGALIGIAIMVVVSFIDYHTILRFSSIIYIGCCAFLVLVLVVGLIRGGAKRWIVLPVLGQIQPSEFVKVGLVIFFADYFGRNEEKMGRVNIMLPAFGLALIPVILILIEPDTSTTVILLFEMACMFFIAGLSYKFIMIVLAVTVPLAAGFLLLIKNGFLGLSDDYRLGRIIAHLDKSAAYSDANLQQDNSIMAIASGKLWGKGLNNTGLESVKNGNFLAEEQTDFIFAIIGEEMGFIGSVAVILLYAIAVFACLHMARKASDIQGRVICTGIGMMLAVQSFTNIAVATGIFPNTGLPLPFISSGVSSLISMYVGIGLVLSVGLHPDDELRRRFL